MFFVTGDTHGRMDVHKLNTRNFPIQKELTRDDYVIVCGDFGFVWNNDKEDNWWQKWLDSRSFTTLFVDGNHENHELLDRYPVSEWNGGKVHFIRPNVIHLMRGQVFDIDGVRFFTMGGAASHDKEYRKEGMSWWAAEMPSAEEYAEAERNLDRVDWKVDYVITHDAPTSVQAYLGAGQYKADELNGFFEKLLDRLEFDTWYFGHYHVDAANIPLPHLNGQGTRENGQLRGYQIDQQFDNGSNGMGTKRVFRGIYRDVVLVEKDREKTFFGETVDERIEDAMEVFEMMDKYESFKDSREIEKA